MAGRTAIAALLALLGGGSLAPAAVLAHSGPAPLLFWGNFAPGVAACQRHIGHAAALCVNRVVRARGDCRLAAETGGSCNTTALTATIQDARADARAKVRAECSEIEVQNLRYIDVNEALTDVINICRSAETTVESAIFDAARAAGAGLGENVVDLCLTEMRSGAGKVLADAIRERRLSLDRIAATNVVPAAKQGIVDHATRRIAAGVAAAATAIERKCPPAAFAALYGRDAATHLATAATQADCFGGAVYVQDAVVCPAPVCGNAMRETGEACDDGNLAPGDGCDAACRTEA